MQHTVQKVSISYGVISSFRRCQHRWRTIACDVSISYGVISSFRRCPGFPWSGISYVSISYGVISSFRPEVICDFCGRIICFNLLRSNQFVSTYSPQQRCSATIDGFNLLRSNQFVSTSYHKMIDRSGAVSISYGVISSFRPLPRHTPRDDTYAFQSPTE